MIRRTRPLHLITVDLDSPSGNAFALLALARDLAEQFGLDAEAIDADPRASDYAHLIQTFDRHFGAVVMMETQREELRRVRSADTE